MNIKNKCYVIIGFILSFALIAGCSSDSSKSSDDGPETGEDVILEDALLNDFPLTETHYVKINIVPPTIVNNEETEQGQILVTVPNTITDFNFSLQSVNFDSEVFSISPAISSSQDFSESKSVIYTISTIEDSAEILHYSVKVIKEGDPEPDPDHNLENAFLTDFPLQETDYLFRNIIDPTVEDDEETAFGDILVTISDDVTDLNLSLKAVNFDTDTFSISPAIGEKQDFSNGQTVVYTITNIVTSEAILHYNVKIIRESDLDPEGESFTVTDFKFEKSKNPGLSEDIEITTTSQDLDNYYIYIFVPVGTDFTDLTPTIIFDGPKMFYYQNSALTPNTSTTEYIPDTSYDFKYPKEFILEVRNDDNTEYTTTHVIVDVVNPIKIETTTVSTPNTTAGNTGTYTVTTWYNQGNHLLVSNPSLPDEQENESPDTEGSVIQATRVISGLGLAPEASNKDIIVNVNGIDHGAGTYTTTAVYHPRFKNHGIIDEYLEPSKLTVTAVIE